MGDPSGFGGGPESGGSTSTTAPSGEATKISCKATFVSLSNGADSRKFLSITIARVSVVWAQFVQGTTTRVVVVDTRSGLGMTPVPDGMSDPKATVFGSVTLDPGSAGCSA